MTPVGSWNAEKVAKEVLVHVFKIAFKASLFLKSVLQESYAKKKTQSGIYCVLS